MEVSKQPSRRSLLLGSSSMIAVSLSVGGCCILPGFPCPPNIIASAIKWIVNNLTKVMTFLGQIPGLSTNQTFIDINNLYKQIVIDANDISSLTNDKTTIVQKIVVELDDFIDTIDKLSALLASIPAVANTPIPWSVVVALLAPVMKYADAARAGIAPPPAPAAAPVPPPAAPPPPSAVELQLGIPPATAVIPPPPSLKAAITGYAASITLDQATTMLTH
jgi:hypothetical protein